MRLLHGEGCPVSKEGEPECLKTGLAAQEGRDVIAGQKPDRHVSLPGAETNGPVRQDMNPLTTSDSHCLKDPPVTTKLNAEMPCVGVWQEGIVCAAIDQHDDVDP